MRKTSLLVSLLLAALALAALAGDVGPTARTKVKTLAAFKNGLGFVYRSGEAKLKDGCCLMEEIPPAALGTLWIGSTDPRNPVQEVVSYQDKVEWDSNATTLADLVAVNVGKEVTLKSSAIEGTIKGTIISVPKDQPMPSEYRPRESPSYSSRGAAYPYQDGGSRGPSAQIVLLKTDLAPKILAIGLNTIQSVEFTGEPVTKTKQSTDVARARVTFAGKPDKSELTLAYLEKGITWSPSYLIDIADPKTADLTLEAVLANDVEDLSDVDVSFVVGFPNYLFADNTTLLNLNQSVGNFIQQLANPGQSSSRGNYSYMTQQVAYSNNMAAYDRDDRAQLGGAYSANQSLPGETNEDLYFYHQKHVTLKKGSRSRYTVLTTKSPYEHLYQWTVTDSMNIDDRGYRRNDNNQQRPEDQVWHVLRLQNASKQPWTTAPAFVVNGSMPVAQDVLKYVPPGGKNTLKLTVATDVRAEQSQTEVSRESVKLHGYNNYEKVTVNGKLVIRNLKQKPIRINVLKTLTGQVITADQGGKATKVVHSLSAANPTSEIEWEFDLKPGEEKTLDYQYSVLINI